MTETTYRIGGAQAPSACVRHQGLSVAFQCQECLDSLCEGCRAPGRQNRCLICHEALARREAGGPAVVVAPAPRSRWRAAIIGITLVNAALAATWVGTVLLRPVPPVVEQSLAAVEALNGLLETSRDAAGLVPPELDSLLERLPADVAQRVKSGSIRYRPSADRRDFELDVALGSRQ
jgi:hypothetical protein